MSALGKGRGRRSCCTPPFSARRLLSPRVQKRNGCSAARPLAHPIKGRGRVCRPPLSACTPVHCSIGTRLPHGCLSFCLHREREVFGPFPPSRLPLPVHRGAKNYCPLLCLYRRGGACIARSFRPAASGSLRRKSAIAALRLFFCLHNEKGK